MEGKCAFCAKYKTLHESHVLPAFVYRWLRGRSGKGHIRNTDNPNRRVQDGLKFHWLCGECEGRFSKYETAFATKLFHPWHQGENSIRYEEWLLKFCVSVSWRVLKFARGRNPHAKYSAEQLVLMDRAEKHWHSYLLGKEPHPGQFEQHLLIFDLIESTTITELPDNTNRFMTGAVTLDIVGSARSLMTFAKLGRFMIFGMIQKGPNAWRGTKVHVKRGILKPGEFTVPIGLLDLIREKATAAASAMDNISSIQQAKIESNILETIEDFAASDQFKSIEADARMFGDESIIWKPRG